MITKPNARVETTQLCSLWKAPEQWSLRKSLLPFRVPRLLHHTMHIECEPFSHEFGIEQFPKSLARMGEQPVHPSLRFPIRATVQRKIVPNRTDSQSPARRTRVDRNLGLIAVNSVSNLGTLFKQLWREATIGMVLHSRDCCQSIGAVSFWFLFNGQTQQGSEVAYL